MSRKVIFGVRNLRHRYDERVVLDVPRLDIFEGELLALVGPSGAGKSTLLRLLNFLENPTEGQILFHGQAYTAETLPLNLRRRITTVFQKPMLLDGSVRRNVSYGLRVRGERNGRSREEATLRSVGLLELADARARTLSGGEAQRVALARALIIEPEALLLDEPTANLDPGNVRIIEKIIARANRERGMTVVLVTHNVWQARRLAHRVGFLYEGRLLELTDTTTFFENPANPKTAAFLRGELIY